MDVRTTRLITLAAGAALLAGCSGGSTTSTHPGIAYLIRGTQLPSYACAAKGNGEPISVPPSSVTKVRLCALNTYPTPGPAISMNRADPRFAGLVHALAEPDQIASPGTMCPEYADLPQTVIGEGPTGPLLIHIPVDGCGHYLSAPLSALSAIRNHQPLPDSRSTAG